MVEPQVLENFYKFFIKILGAEELLKIILGTKKFFSHALGTRKPRYSRPPTPLQKGRSDTIAERAAIHFPALI